ncbi:hypothetical protein JB92DRAFT_122447 [Gautieria morchelliformis]|nr:hypothetical protein JB92DRAFT_122447 [Gautieria morchelliformis]
MATHREYELTVRQQPKQARMCGVGGKGACASASHRVALTLSFSPSRPPPDRPAAHRPAPRHLPARRPEPQRRPALRTPARAQPPQRPQQPRSSSRRTRRRIPRRRIRAPARGRAGAGPRRHVRVRTRPLQHPALVPPEPVLLHVREPRVAGHGRRAAPPQGRQDALHHGERGEQFVSSQGACAVVFPSRGADLPFSWQDAENGGQDAGFFVFPDLSVRTEGSYRLKLTLFEVIGWVFRLHLRLRFFVVFFLVISLFACTPHHIRTFPLSCVLVPFTLHAVPPSHA